MTYDPSTLVGRSPDGEAPGGPGVLHQGRPAPARGAAGVGQRGQGGPCLMELGVATRALCLSAYLLLNSDKLRTPTPTPHTRVLVSLSRNYVVGSPSGGGVRWQ